MGNNTSNIQVKVWCKRTNSGYSSYGNGTVYLNVDGQTRQSAINNSQTITDTPRLLHDESYNISHNGDGTKTIYIQSYITHDRFTSSWQGFSFALNTIPRTSSVSISNNNVDAGGNINVTINSASSSFRHIFHLVFGDGVYSFGSNVAGGTYKVTIPMECLIKIPSANSGTGTIYCDTYNGSTKIGTSGVGITINVPSSTQPNFGYIGAEALDTKWGKYIQWHSKCKLSINEINASYGSWVTSYRITGSNLDGYGQQCTTGAITNYGTLTYTATITDARGRTCTKTTTIDVHQYYNPSFNWVKAFRSNGSGNTDPTGGTYISVSGSWIHASVGGSNGSTCYVCYRSYPSGTWTNESTLSYEASKVIGDGSIHPGSEFEVRFRVNDGVGNDTYSYIKIPTSACVIGYKAGGKGLSIGKHPTREGFDCDWQTYFNNGFTVIGETVHNGKSSFTDFVSALYFSATSSGKAENFKVGDDAWIGDCDTSNMVMIKGQQNGAAGWMTFGNGGGKIGYNGANGSGIDILPGGLNGAVNQIYLGSLVLCGGAICPNTSGGNGMDVGISSRRWNTIYATNGVINTSDKTYKENIKYMSYSDDHNITDSYYISTHEQEAERLKHYDFIRGINFASWDWIDGNKDGLDNIGFIAQDIADTEIGDRILYYTEDGGYGYSLSNYVTTIAIALQHSINEVEELKAENKELKDRLAKIEAMLGVV